MNTYILYDGPAGAGRLKVAARPAAVSTPQAQWLVRFVCRSTSAKKLDQTAAWMPALQAWDRGRWHPINSRLIPPAVLADVEAWLRGRPVGDTENTTNTEAS